MAKQNSRSRRHSFPRYCLLLGACVAFAGCAAAPVNPEAHFVAPEPGRAVVIGWGNSAVEKAQAALTPGKGTRVSSLVVSKANEQKAGFGENIARLAPGEYKLTITCDLYVDTRHFPHDTTVHATLRADRVYRLRATPEGRRCQPSIEDVTGKER
jgi:hypothetical protein